MLNGFEAIEDGFNALQLYTEAKENNPGNIDQAKADFLKVCSNGACDGPLQVMLDALDGGEFVQGQFACDLSEKISRGAPSGPNNVFRGHRDLALMMHSGVFNYAMVGLIV